MVWAQACAFTASLLSLFTPGERRERREAAGVNIHSVQHSLFRTSSFHQAKGAKGAKGAAQA